MSPEEMAAMVAILVEGLADMEGKPITEEAIAEVKRRVNARMKIMPQLLTSESGGGSQ